MNLIFITLSNINGVLQRGIYADLMRKFRDEGHQVYIVSSAERCTGVATQLMDVDDVHILKVRTLNVQKTNVVEKGIGTLMMESQYKRAIKKYLGHVQYIRQKYSMPLDKPIFIYGGNLGKPQGIDYLIKCLDANKHRKDSFFVVLGNGTEYGKIETWYHDNADENLNVKLMARLPKEDYDMLVRSCDVGLIFLDYRFTIPSYPSRLLPYLEYKTPIICCTDPNTDIGRMAEQNGYGFWCESVRPEDFTALVDMMLQSDRKAMGERGYEFLKKNYTVQNTYDAIMHHLK